jgi:hypothetical protein
MDDWTLGLGSMLAVIIDWVNFIDCTVSPIKSK